MGIKISSVRDLIANKLVIKNNEYSTDQSDNVTISCNFYLLEMEQDWVYQPQGSSVLSESEEIYYHRRKYILPSHTTKGYCRYKQTELLLMVHIIVLLGQMLPNLTGNLKEQQANLIDSQHSRAAPESTAVLPGPWDCLQWGATLLSRWIHSICCFQLSN